MTSSKRIPGWRKAWSSAFTKAKEIGIKHVSDTRRSFLAWYGAEIEEELELFGANAWPYNLRDNLKELETMARYAQMVGITEPSLNSRICSPRLRWRRNQFELKRPSVIPAKAGIQVEVGRLQIWFPHLRG